MSTTKIPNELLSSGVGTSASNLVELDSSGKLPVIDGSAVTSLSSANLTGALPVLDGSNLTGLTPTPTKASIDALGISASSITGALPVIDGSALTGVAPTKATIDALGISASSITGALPVISGANLTGVGVDGIVSTADGTAITIDQNENVGIGITPTEKLHINGTLKTAGKVGLNSEIHADSQVMIYTSSADDNILRVNAGSGGYVGTALEVQIAKQTGESGYYLTKMISKHDNASPATRFSVRGDGLTTVDGTLNVKTGITFSNDTAAANTLDDYEEGNWTPVLDGTSNTPTWYNIKGRYVKIGSLVYASGFLQSNNTPTFTNPQAHLKISGLPFTPNTDSNGYYHTAGTMASQSFSFNGGTYNAYGTTGQCVPQIEGTKVVFMVFGSGSSAIRNNVKNIGWGTAVVEWFLTYRAT